MTSEEIDMQTALDNAIFDFQTRGRIENKVCIDAVRDAYKKVSGSMMRNYAREIGGESFVRAVDVILN